MKKNFDLQYKLVSLTNADIVTASGKGNLAPGGFADGTGVATRVTPGSPVREGLSN